MVVTAETDKAFGFEKGNETDWLGVEARIGSPHIITVSCISRGIIGSWRRRNSSRRRPRSLANQPTGRANRVFRVFDVWKFQVSLQLHLFFSETKYEVNDEPLSKNDKKKKKERQRSQLHWHGEASDWKEKKVHFGSVAGNTPQSFRVGLHLHLLKVAMGKTTKPN